MPADRCDACESTVTTRYSPEHAARFCARCFERENGVPRIEASPVAGAPADREWPDAAAVEAAARAICQAPGETNRAIARGVARLALTAAVEASPVVPGCEVERRPNENKRLRQRLDDALEVLAAALGAPAERPVVPVPPCPTCDGTGVDAAEVEPDAACVCPSCNGSGRDRLIPESEIRARFEGVTHGGGPPPHFVLGYNAALEDLLRWLDERNTGGSE